MKKDLKWFIPVLIYFAGLFFIPITNIDLLKNKGLASQEEYTYVDSEGDDREGESLIEIRGVGRILTYKDVYLASIPMFLLSLIFGEIIIKDHSSIGHIMFANCVLGVLLVWLTSEGTIVSTVLFWLGIFATGFVKEYKSNR